MSPSPFAVAMLALAAASVGGELPGLAAVQSASGNPVKPGRWEFTARLQPPAARPSASGQSAGGQQEQSANGLAATYAMCVDARQAIPSELGPNCKVERLERSGGQISWSMVCANQESTVHSEGRAQYRGDVMAATLVNHLPGTDGRVTDITQHIAGRYVGPCPQSAHLPMPPAQPNTPTSGAGQTADSPVVAQPASPSAEAGTAGEEAAAPRRRYYRHYALRHRHYHRHYRHYRYYAGGYAGPPNIFALPFMGLRALFGR